MDRFDNDNWLDEALTKAISSQETKPNFEKWKQEHPEAVEMLTSRTGRQVSAFTRPLNIRNIIMKSPIAKLSSVAAVIATLVLIGFWVRPPSPAYALDQTVKALKNVRFLHIIGRDDTGRINDERWIEIGVDGIQVRYRQQNPLWVIEKYPSAPIMVIEDGECTAVYRHDKKAVIIYDRDDEQYQWVGELGKAFENLRQEGKILKQNDTYHGQRAHKVWWPYMTAECYVDPKTKLPIAIGATELSYEEPPAGTFEIFFPEGYVVVDRRPGATEPIPQWLLEEETKRECFHHGTYALARRDYAEAARQLEQAIGYDSWAWFWLGSAYYELGQYELAVENFTKLIDLCKKLGDWPIPYCHYTRGLAYARSGNLEAAKADFQVCLPTMVKALRLPSAGNIFEYADNPMIRYGEYHPSEREIVVKMINRLRIVTGQNFSYDPSKTTAENEQAIVAWEDWFKNSGQIQFTPNAELLPVPEVVEQAEK